MKRTRIAITILAFAALGIGIIAAADIFSSVSDNLRIYRDVVQYLLSEYVDEIDSEELLSSGISGMLNDLDPYTVYISEDEQQSMEILTRGNYHGVGIQLGIRDNKLTVIAPIEGSPAYRAGVRPGDIIVRINQESTENFTSEDAGMKIRGRAGTEVTLTLERYGEENLLDITLVREIIDVNDLPYFGVIDGIGYIRVSRFSNNTAEEFRDAVVELQEQGINGLVVDLRDNPGGLLEDAVIMVDALIEPGQLIVETRGRTNKVNRKFMSENEPVLDAETPLAILVNQGSASASEIVAGAIQDLDRGVIVGERTFGKGLVQSVYPIGNNASLKMTTAKYYIPSGRLIQMEDYLNNGVLTEDLDKKDSLFVTSNGRVVLGGGGITPDIELAPTLLPPLTNQLQNLDMFFSFATQKREQYNLALPVVISDVIMEDFHQVIEEKEIEPVFPGMTMIESFEARIEDLESFEGEVDLSELKDYYQKRAETAFNEEYEQIKRMLRLEFAATIGGSRERARSSLQDDTCYQEAVEILQNSMAYQQIFQPNEQTAHLE